MALSQPWMLPDGGGSVLDVNDRIYQADSESKCWFSSSAAQRQRAVSNYQFSNPAEWFAEAYAGRGAAAGAR
jgi:hypothetical protein